MAAARQVAKGIAALGIPVFFYGELGTSPERVERAYFREGGPAELARRMKSGELKPDLGPAEPSRRRRDPRHGQEPQVAFNVELDTPNPEIARTIAAELREAGGGLPGVRALGLPREGERTQVSMNIHDPNAVPLAAVVTEIVHLAGGHGVRVIEAELVGLVPEAALKGYPGEPPIATSTRGVT